jgi:hypothetical protein
MPNTSLAYTKLLFEGLYKVSQDRQTFVEQSNMVDRIYTRITDSTKATEEFFCVGQVPDVQDFTGRFSELSMTPGYSTKIEAKQFGGFVETERTLMDDEQYGVMTLGAIEAGLVDSANRGREDSAVKPIANATSSAFDFITNQEEGVALASNSHTTKRVGVDTSIGYSNLGTAALNKTSSAAARILMRKFKTPLGRRYSTNRRWGLLVPDSLEFKAKEINNTPWGLDSGQRNENLQMGIYEVIVWERMEDYSTSNWAMVDLDMMKKNMVFVDRIKGETERERDFMTKAIRQSIYDRYAVGFIDWRHIFWQQVA